MARRDRIWPRTWSDVWGTVIYNDGHGQTISGTWGEPTAQPLPDIEVIGQDDVSVEATE